MKRSITVAALALACVGFLTSHAEAKHHSLRQPCNGSDIMRPCMPIPVASQNFLEGVQSINVKMRREGRRTLRRVSEGLQTAAQVLPHPSGCPRRAFCGCGASVEVFGRPIRSLYLAANWLKFPQTSPAPGMVAARRGHVFVLKQHVSGNVWIAYDANSGKRLTRIHARSIAGFTIVDPTGSSHMT